MTWNKFAHYTPMFALVLHSNPGTYSGSKPSGVLSCALARMHMCILEVREIVRSLIISNKVRFLLSSKSAFPVNLPTSDLFLLVIQVCSASTDPNEDGQWSQGLVSAVSQTLEIS